MRPAALTRPPSNHQPVTEGAIALQGLAEVFGRDRLALAPLAFQNAVRAGKPQRHLLDHLRHPRIRLRQRWMGFIHKLALDFIPARPESLGYFLVKQGGQGAPFRPNASYKRGRPL